MAPYPTATDAYPHDVEPAGKTGASSLPHISPSQVAVARSVERAPAPPSLASDSVAAEPRSQASAQQPSWTEPPPANSQSLWHTALTSCVHVRSQLPTNCSILTRTLNPVRLCTPGSGPSPAALSDDEKVAASASGYSTPASGMHYAYPSPAAPSPPAAAGISAKQTARAIREAARIKNRQDSMNWGDGWSEETAREREGRVSWGRRERGQGRAESMGRAELMGEEEPSVSYAQYAQF